MSSMVRRTSWRNILHRDDDLNWNRLDFGPALQRHGWCPGMIPIERPGQVPIGTRVRLKRRGGGLFVWNKQATMLDHGIAVADGCPCEYVPGSGCTIVEPAREWIALEDQSLNPEHLLCLASALKLIAPEGQAPYEPCKHARDAWLAAIITKALAMVAQAQLASCERTEDTSPAPIAYN